MQFEEYAGFAATMRALRNQKLVRKEDKYFAVSIVVDFDRDRHLSDASIKRRQVVRDRCIAKEMAKEEEERKKKEAEEERLEQERCALGERIVSTGVTSKFCIAFTLRVDKRRPNRSSSNWTNSWSARTNAKRSSCRSCAAKS